MLYKRCDRRVVQMQQEKGRCFICGKCDKRQVLTDEKGRCCLELPYWGDYEVPETSMRRDVLGE